MAFASGQRARSRQKDVVLAGLRTHAPAITVRKPTGPSSFTADGTGLLLEHK